MKQLAIAFAVDAEPYDYDQDELNDLHDMIDSFRCVLCDGAITRELEGDSGFDRRNYRELVRVLTQGVSWNRSRLQGECWLNST